MKVLIIDDSATARLFVKKMATMIMGETPIESIEADSGESAFRVLRENKGFDLIISDVNMPEMSGFTFMHNIQLDSSLSHIPIIFITSLSNAANVENLEKLGAKAVLSKPVKLQELKETFEQLDLIHSVNENDDWG